MGKPARAARLIPANRRARRDPQLSRLNSVMARAMAGPEITRAGGLGKMSESQVLPFHKLNSWAIS